MKLDNMGFRKLFSKDPKEKISKKILEMQFGDRAINIVDSFPKQDSKLIRFVIQELIDSGEINGILVGKQGWFLPNGEAKIEQTLNELARGSQNLDTLANDWKLNKKRVFIALTDYLEKNAQLEQVIIRKKDLIFLQSYLKQEWTNSLAAFEFDNPISYDAVINNAAVPRESKEVLADQVKKWLVEEGSYLVLGNDNLLRKRDDLPIYLAEGIDLKWEEGADKIEFSELAEEYGILREEIHGIIQQLIENKELDNITVYPLDEILKQRL
jgi:hypothetical protein